MPEEIIVKTFQPVVLFMKFGESNVDFIVVLRGTTRGNTFAINNELIRRLHARFVQEGIEINYPVRKVIHAGANGMDPRRQGLAKDSAGTS